MIRTVAKLTDTDVTRFRGLNNVSDPMRLDAGWLTVARNVHVTDQDAIERREGYTLHAAGTITAAYGTRDFQRMFYVDGGSLKDGSGRVLASGITASRMHWAEVNEQVYFNNGASSGVIAQDNQVLPWAWNVPASPTLAAVTGSLAPGQYRVVCTQVLPDGRETGTSDEVSITIAEGQALQVSALPSASGYTTRTYIAPANSQVFGLARVGSAAFVWDHDPTALGVECSTYGLDPLPAGATVVQIWNGRAWAALFDQSTGATYLFRSRPLAFHLFDLEDYDVLAGEVLMLAPHDQGLVVGTATSISVIDAAGAVTFVAGYGVVPGQPWAFDEDDSILIWSTRGVCRALPLKNLTEGYLSVAPGVHAGAAVVSAGGQRLFIVSLHAGGTAFNQR